MQGFFVCRKPERVKIEVELGKNGVISLS